MQKKEIFWSAKKIIWITIGLVIICNGLLRTIAGELLDHQRMITLLFQRDGASGVRTIHAEETASTPRTPAPVTAPAGTTSRRSALTPVRPPPPRLRRETATTGWMRRVTAATVSILDLMGYGTSNETILIFSLVLHSVRGGGSYLTITHDALELTLRDAGVKF